MSDEVASLGFAVDSSQLDSAKQKLNDLGSQADKTGKSVDDFNQSVSKTAASASGASSSLGTITPGLSSIEAAARRAGVSVGEMQARTAAFNAESATLATTAAASGTALGAIAKQAGAAAPGLTALGAASKAAATEHAAHNAAATTLRETLHGLGPVIGSLGGSLGGLREFSGVARVGIEALAAAAGVTALIALQKLGDEVDRSKNRFAGLTGSVEGGEAAYDAVKAAAKSSGVELSTLASAVEKASIGQSMFADRNVIYANTAENAARETVGLASALGTVGKIMQTNLANADEEKKALDALATSFQTTGTLSVAAFKAIQAESPSTALAIANAFGFQKVSDFVKELGKSSLTIEQFIQQMARVKPAVDAAFDPDKPKTFDQALREVKSSFTDLLEELAKVGVFDAVKTALANTKPEIEALAHPLDTLAEKFKSTGETSAKSWGDFVTFAEDKTSVFGQSITIDVDGALVKVLASLGQLPSSGLASITSWANGAIAEFEKMAASAVSSAQQAVAALSQVGSAAASAASAAPGALGGAVSAAGGAGGTEFQSMGPDFSGGSTSADTGSSAVVSSVPDYSGVSDYLSALPAFADGGSLTVTGGGGTDSQLVQFKATPGEVVTVSTPGQMATSASSSSSSSSSSGGIQGLTTIQNQPVAGVISATPDPSALATIKQLTDAIGQSSIDITKQIATGNNDIVNALARLTGGVAASSVNPATGLPAASGVASGVGSSASQALTASQIQQFGFSNNPAIAQMQATQIGSSGGSSGGGGASMGGGSSWGYSGQSMNNKAPAQQPIAAKAFNGNPNYGYPGGARGTAAPTQHLSPTPFPAGFPVNPDGTPAMGAGGTQAFNEDGLIRGMAPQSLSQMDSMFQNQVQELQRDFQSQQAFNENIAQQNGGMQTMAPGQISSSYPPPTLGSYDNNMNFVPAQPNNNWGFAPNNNDYTFAGKLNAAGPYQPGISTPLSFPSYNDYLKSLSARNIPLPASRPAEADAIKPLGDKIGTTALDQISAANKNASKIADAVKSGASSSSEGFQSAMASLGSEIQASLASLDGGAQSGGAVGGASGSSGRYASGGSSGGRGGVSGYNGFGYAGSGLPGSNYSTGGDFGVGGSSVGDVASQYMDSGGSDYTGGAASYNDYGYGNYTGDYSTGGDYGVGGSSVGDVASQYMSSGGADYSSGGDFGGAADSSPFPGFAVGGQFTVTGDGGTDTTPVKFMGTKGEVVTITPAGRVNTPTGVVMSPQNPQPSASPASSQGSGGTTTKTVNMYLHPGVQADQFIRSRAQIARGIQ